MKNKVFKRIFSRFPLTALIIILMFVALYLISVYGFYYLGNALVALFPALEEYTEHMEIGFEIMRWIIVLIAVLHCANRDMVPETKIPWLLCITIMNLFGVAIYVVFSWHRPSRKERRLYRALFDITEERAAKGSSPEELRSKMGHWSAVSVALSTANPSAAIHAGTKTEYFPVGEKFRDRLLGDLEHAEKYILLEYFIIERGEFWNAILEILERKVKEGVIVRLMYDDIGCMGKIHLNYHRTLRKKGIDCIKFNPFVPVVTSVHNNRDHRKIVVIDGKVGYTGGINLADEYVNAVQPFGHWKDTAVRLEGAGVHNLTLLFYRLYCMQKKEVEDITPFLVQKHEHFEDEGFVQPFGDGPHPLYKRHLGEDVYVNIISSANKYVWISTPYLIIDYRMREALTLAAQRGVDVRIVTPHVPDKKVAFALTRSNYAALIKGGVKIYEYTPGFMHAKMVLADDDVALVGTINLDYRAFLYHFEDAVLMYKTRAMESMKADMATTFSLSKQQTLEDAKRSVVWRWVCEIAKLFAPLF
ncbi:MAG: cardiolipin synthase [Clostridia bacterium]|nr:cardiolipin synthase [Clostridia bacterium]